MRNLTLALIICFCSISFGQELVYNEQLFIQLTKNQSMRVVSNYLFESNLQQQNEKYEQIRNKTAEIMAIHEYIFDKLRNVNRNISQGKKVYYTLQYVDDIIENTAQLIDDASQYPAVAATLTRYYNYILQQAIEIQNEIQNLLTEDDAFLMDSYDREILIDKVYSRIRNINSSLKYVSLLIDARRNKPLIYYAPVIGNYAIIDREIINGIMQRWNWLTN